MNTRCALKLINVQKPLCFLHLPANKLITHLHSCRQRTIISIKSLRTYILTLKTGQCPGQSGSSTSITSCTIFTTIVEDSTLIFKMMTSKDCPSCSCSCNEEFGEDTICCCHDYYYVVAVAVYWATTSTTIAIGAQSEGGGDSYSYGGISTKSSANRRSWIWIFYAEQGT